MTTPVEARDVLNRLARDVGELSGMLADVARQLEPVEQEYTAFMDSFETNLWREHLQGAKLPSAAMRQKLAHQEIDPELLGRYVALTNSRTRLRERLRDKRVEVEAQRSILSGLKAEMEGSS